MPNWNDENISQPTFSGMEPEEDGIGDASVCWVHSESLDDECDFCEAEIVARDGVLSALNDRLSARGKQLASQGGGIDPSSIVDARLNILLDVIFGDDVRQRMRYEHEFARHMLLVFDEAERQIRMQQITGYNEANPHSTLHTPGNL